MDAHRQWLIDRYGPICAYCGTDIDVNRTTLDHVYPRKGQTAYDRPDNLVIAQWEVEVRWLEELERSVQLVM